jgi:hypothetical protein
MFFACSTQGTSGTFLSHRPTAVLLQRQAQRELDRPSFTGAGAHVGQLAGWACVTVPLARRVGVDDQIDPFLEAMRRDLTRSKLEDPTGASWRNSNAPGSHVFGEPEDAHLAIQKNDVNGKPHAQRVNAAARNQQQAFFLEHGAATQQPHATGLKGARQVDVARDAPARGGT